jgi:DNA-binding sugar fermentation-stimulating protein
MSGRNDYAVIAHHGEPPTVRYGIAAAAMEKLKRFRAEINDSGETVDAVYDDAGAITLADYNGLPIGSEIRDLESKKTHWKTGATTWVSSAASA